jgi:hypothetical protein
MALMSALVTRKRPAELTPLRSGDNLWDASRHVCTSKAGPATALTRVLRIHQVNRTKEKFD